MTKMVQLSVAQLLKQVSHSSQRLIQQTLWCVCLKAAALQQKLSNDERESQPCWGFFSEDKTFFWDLPWVMADVSDFLRSSMTKFWAESLKTSECLTLIASGVFITVTSLGLSWRGSQNLFYMPYRDLSFVSYLNLVDCCNESQPCWGFFLHKCKLES